MRCGSGNVVMAWREDRCMSMRVFEHSGKVDGSDSVRDGDSLAA